MTEVDVEHQIKAVERKLGSRIIDAKEAHVVTISQSYDTDQQDLWDAVTNIERIPRWLMPISGDLTVGGWYQLEGQAGGTVLTCDPPKNFTATWEFGGGISWIDVSVSADGADRSRLVIEHIAHVNNHWEQFGPGAVGMGWDSMVPGSQSTLRRARRSTRRSAKSGSSPRTGATSSSCPVSSGTPRTWRLGRTPTRRARCPSDA